ncbi:hypothetical protein N7486_008799 [Penicillium sp. IBT 16267x]|nr:hypothetical protein N7486_008799 [Penicillium sp. IBT 16267x]
MTRDDFLKSSTAYELYKTRTEKGEMQLPEYEKKSDGAIIHPGEKFCRVKTCHKKNVVEGLLHLHLHLHGSLLV